MFIIPALYKVPAVSCQIQPSNCMFDFFLNSIYFTLIFQAHFTYLAQGYILFILNFTILKVIAW